MLHMLMSQEGWIDPLLQAVQGAPAEPLGRQEEADRHLDFAILCIDLQK